MFTEVWTIIYYRINKSIENSYNRNIKDKNCWYLNYVIKIIIIITTYIYVVINTAKWQFWLFCKLNKYYLSII